MIYSSIAGIAVLLSDQKAPDWVGSLFMFREWGTATESASVCEVIVDC